MSLRFPTLILFFWMFGILTALQAQTHYHYSYIPKQVYFHQVFPVTILALNVQRLKTPTFRFDPKSSFQPLESRPLEVSNGHEIFYTFYFKADKEEIKIPDLWIQDEERSIRLLGTQIPVTRLHAAPEDRFCGVIASDLKIRNSQVSTFDEKHNLIYLKIEAHEANLEDMKIPGVVESGIEKFARHGAIATAEYYFVIPANIKEICFRYYNPIKQQFIPMSVSTNYSHKEVAAQVDLNPKDSSFTLLKKYSFLALSLFFLLMFLSSRDLFYLLLFTVTVTTLLTFYMPLKKICIREGAPLYILPIPHSTVGMKIDHRLKAPQLKKYKNFYKIEYQHGITGWVKDEDLCKN